MELFLNQIFSYALYLYNNYTLISWIFLNCIWTIILYLMLLKNLKNPKDMKGGASINSYFRMFLTLIKKEETNLVTKVSIEL